jgi:hypothetical protein
MKNSSDTIGNRTRDIPTSGSVPQPTAPPRADQPPATHVYNTRGCKYSLDATDDERK